ncbi:SMC-Scp complex subunit ScpB, partial [Paractinoplanes brasiliensis]
ESDRAGSERAEGDRAGSERAEGDRAESDRAGGDRAESDRAEGADARGDRLEGAGGEGGADEAAVVDAAAAGARAAAEGEGEPVKRSKGAKARAVPGQKRRAGEPLGTGDESSPRTGNADVDLPGLTDDAELAGALEAIMLVVDEPVGELQLAQILEQPTERIAAMLDNLSARYTAAGHGFDLRRVAGGWRLYTRPEYAAYVERFVLDGQSVRLTQAALETLAVVAYKQPVTRSRISAIRGVNCDGVMRTLATRGLIEECGTESETGAHLYRTTGLFLEKLGLNSVDQLPPLAPFLPDDVEEVLDATG